MTRRRVDLPVLTLGGAALLGSAFTFSSGGPAQIEFIHIRGAGLVLLLILGVAAVVAGILRVRGLAVVSGAGFVAAALLQLLQADRSVNWLDGDGSTVALMGGLGIGLLAVTLTPRPSADAVSVPTARKGTNHDESDRAA
ncbi:Rv1678 family membrane protein [Arthrobacter sp. CG_A4]|uniref:Rv1678 family membrane protein n=1 Tax=Arthrobacter sp. CG_A4 TaxID=3071706 RepID=UPI002E000EF1|nr:peptidoglycan/LPS O-acetylase OafA/YrhL [Arthrobacter sp. CG_A4]